MTTPRPNVAGFDANRLFPNMRGENGRICTGIVELDRMLNGGFMDGDAVLLAGSTGTGKTTLALQYLVNGIGYGDPGVYVTFEELPAQIYRDANNFGWDLRGMEEENKLRVICTSPDIILESQGENLLDEATRDIRPRRIVIDSLSHLEMYVKKQDLRREAYRLISYLKTKGMSSLLIWESAQISGSAFMVTSLGLSFLVDSIVMLKPVEIESSVRKAMAILKMRGSDHDKELREFKITARGIEIGSSFNDYEGIMTGTPTKVSKIQGAVEGFSQAFGGKGKKT